MERLNFLRESKIGVSSFLMETFGAWILGQLESRGWSQAELARRAGIAEGTLSRIISGTQRAGSDATLAIARGLRTSPEMVFQRAGLLPPSPQNGDLSPEALADLDQIRRYLAMLSPDAQRRTAEQLVNLARLAIDLSEPDHSENAA